MSAFSGIRTVTSNLVYAHDLANTQKSWRGPPVTNLLPTPAINSVPTTGNGWSTYNTNQYGAGTYFSIGTVASVSGNIVTMTANHSLRSYDVMQPQTTGGGVTAATNYLIKKLSNTTFSLHPYNASQDGSQGYINPSTGTHKVYDDFANNVQISINPTSFPTMWWGAPHLPNSGLVKEIRTAGCSIPGYPTTDCMRLYHTRPDGVTDGMAYGVDAPVTAGIAHTVSFWTKTVNAAAVGQSVSYQIYNYGASSTGFSFSATLGAVGVWVKQSMTFTPVYATCISYFFPSTGNIIYDLAHIQFETGSVASSWTSSSRSSSQALVNLVTEDSAPLTVNNLTYSNDSTNSFSFTYSNPSFITIPLSTAFNKTEGTMNFWVYPTRYNGGNGYFVNREDDVPNAADWFWIGPYSDYFYFRIGDGATCCNNDLSFGPGAQSVIPLNTWTNICCTWKINATSVIYKNGVSYTSRSIGNIPATNPAANGRIGLGHDNADDYFNGIMPSVEIYSRQLTASEVLQNFETKQRKYGI